MCLLFPHIPDWKNTVREAQAALRFIGHKMPDSSLGISISTSKAAPLVRYYHSEFGQHCGYLALCYSMRYCTSRPDDLSSPHVLLRFPCFNFVISNLSLEVMSFTALEDRKSHYLKSVYTEYLIAAKICPRLWNIILCMKR